VYTANFEILGNPFDGLAELVRRGQPLYGFDADSITPFFPGYRRMKSNTGYASIEARVIAPVPDKSEGLKRDFIRDTYLKAVSLVREAGTLVTLGYSFNVHDRGSYDRILQALAQSRDRTLFIVSPEATTLAPRIAAGYPRLKVRTIQKTFRKWAVDSFRTPQCALTRFFVKR
jgi:hypothetical protein